MQNMANIRSGCEKRINGPIRLMFVGSPLVDISLECDDKVLQELGLDPNDCVRARDEHDALFKCTFEHPSAILSAGGSAVNSARIAKWVLKDKGEVFFTGSIGEDEFAGWLQNQLTSENVTPLYVKEPATKTGMCVCLLDSHGNRSMCTRQGAAALYSAAHLNLPHIRRELEDSNCIFVVGYFVAHSPEVVLRLMESCSPNQLFTLSLSAEYICREYTELLVRVLPRVDVLFGNEAEMKALAMALTGGQQMLAITDSIRCIRKLPRTGSAKPRIVVITCGSDPIVVDDGSCFLHTFNVTQVPHAVDSVGCGDAFAGAFLAAYAYTMDVNVAVHTGIQAAVEILQVHGCSPPSSDIFIEENKAES